MTTMEVQTIADSICLKIKIQGIFAITVQKVYPDPIIDSGHFAKPRFPLILAKRQ